MFCLFFFKQKTAYEMRISDWSSDVCSSDLARLGRADHRDAVGGVKVIGEDRDAAENLAGADEAEHHLPAVASRLRDADRARQQHMRALDRFALVEHRSEERSVGKECVRTCRYRWSADH